jgi:adenine-specific DNA-methyltransferase
MDGESLNITGEKKAQLQSVLPEVFTEGKIDLEKLKLAIGEDLNIQNERYVLNWAGKSEAFKVLQTPTTATLVPDKSESVNFDTTENIFIEGENLEVLKILQKSYYGKIKMIYIDPPYNTGNDSFIYPDRFAENKEDYLKRIGDKDEDGYLLKEGLFRKNSKESGQYHSNWLSMMYPRLFLARNLLKDDGVIFVSIDDNEVHNLRIMMNEILGEENMLQQIVWRRHAGGGNDSKHFAVDHEYLMAYAKNKNAINLLRCPLSDEDIAEYKYKDKYVNTLGLHKLKSFRRMRPDDPRPTLTYDIQAPDNTILRDTWKWEQSRFLQALEKEKVMFRKDRNGKWQIEYKIYLKSRTEDDDDDGCEKTKVPRSLLLEVERNAEGKKQLRDAINGENIFNNPKPIGLIEYLMSFSVSNKDVIFDFFSGSATTAHAVLNLNKQDNGNRKFILVQLPEKCSEDSEAFKAGYKTIADIGKERIRRVIKKLNESEDGKLDLSDGKKQDRGFKVYKLRPSNFKIWRSSIDTPEELVKQVDAFVDPTKEGSTEENMLYELLLKTGRDLNSKVEKRVCDSVDYYYINNGEMIIVLSKITEKLIKEIIAKKPQKVIALDKLFEDNDQLKTNTVLQMKDAEIDFRTI